MKGLAIALQLAMGWFGEGPTTVEPAYAVTPEFCWSEPRWVSDDRLEDPAKDPIKVARAIAGQVVIQSSSDGWRGRTFGNRMADKIVGKPGRGRYVEVQFYICDQNGKPNYERNDPDLEYGHRLGLRSRPAPAAQLQPRPADQ